MLDSGVPSPLISDGRGGEWMTSAVAVRQMPWLRYALLGAVFSALWLAISLFTTASSASADEEPSGLLGTTGSLLGGVTTVTSTVGETLDAVVDTVVEPVGQLVEPVDAIVDPITGTLDDVIGGVPIVGDGLIPQLPDVPLLPGDTDGPGEPVVAPAPANGVPPGAAGPALLPGASEASGSVDPAHGGTVMPADGGTPPGGALPPAPAAPAGGACSGAAGSPGGGGASGTSDAAFAALELDALASLVLHAVDDELPSSPVHDTDTTPY